MKQTHITFIKCSTCGKIVSKNKNEINRQKRKGKHTFYCTISCASKNPNNINHLKQFHEKFVQQKYVRKQDDYSKFRWYIKNIIKNSKKRKQIYDIDLEYLKNLWESQNGICPFTDKKLQLKTHNKDRIVNKAYQASIDRIDNNKGYVKGNIRFVALIFNYAKNTFSDDDVIDFCKHVNTKYFTKGV